MLEGLTGIFDGNTLDWDPQDTDQSGLLDGPDIPYEPGSLEAKKAWAHVEAEAHSPENIQRAKALGYENARGMYQGKVLAPGAGTDQGDFNLLRDKLVYSQGYSPEVAQKIAAKSRWMNCGD